MFGPSLSVLKNSKFTFGDGTSGYPHCYSELQRIWLNHWFLTFSPAPATAIECLPALMPPSSPRSFPGRSDSKESTWNAGDPGSIPGSGRSPRGPSQAAATMCLPYNNFPDKRYILRYTLFMPTGEARPLSCPRECTVISLSKLSTLLSSDWFTNGCGRELRPSV